MKKGISMIKKNLLTRAYIVIILLGFCPFQNLKAQISNYHPIEVQALYNFLMEESNIEISEGCDPLYEINYKHFLANEPSLISDAWLEEMKSYNWPVSFNADNRVTAIDLGGMSCLAGSLVLDNFALLVNLNVSFLKLDMLIIKNCPQLTTVLAGNILTLDGENKMEIVNCPNITYLDISGGAGQFFDFSDSFPVLEILNCSENSINETIDFSQFPNLRELNYANNEITATALPVTLEILDCSSNSFPDNVLDISSLVNLTELKCTCNDLTEIVLSPGIFLNSSSVVAHNKFSYPVLSDYFNGFGNIPNTGSVFPQRVILKGDVTAGEAIDFSDEYNLGISGLNNYTWYDITSDNDSLKNVMLSIKEIRSNLYQDFLDDKPQHSNSDFESIASGRFYTKDEDAGKTLVCRIDGFLPPDGFMPMADPGTDSKIYILIDILGLDTATSYRVDCPKDTLITLPYGECGKILTLDTPRVFSFDNGSEYFNAIITNDNQDSVFIPGIHRIKWEILDEYSLFIDTCIQFVIVNYPPCGSGDTTWILLDPESHIISYRTDSLYATDGEGNRYPTTRIGCDCWTAENLRSTSYQQDGTPAPDTRIYIADMYPDSTANKSTYGLLYNWNTASKNSTEDTAGRIQGICPDGWVLPESSEFESLIPYGIAALSQPGLWLGDLPMINTTGFSVLPAGYYQYTTDSYYFLLGDAYFWIATSDNSSFGQCAHIRYNCPLMTIETISKQNAISVRCVKID